MEKVLASFHLTSEQRAKYDAARVATSREMREVHEGKVSGAMKQKEVFKKALASHKAFDAASSPALADGAIFMRTVAHLLRIDSPR